MPAAWRFPILLAIVVVVLGALEISGSSASLYAGRDGGVIVGRALYEGAFTVPQALSACRGDT